MAKAETTYAVAKERCDDLSGNPKDVCVKEAKAAEVKAKADAKLGKEIGEARKDAAADKRDGRLQGGHGEVRGPGRRREDELHGQRAEDLRQELIAPRRPPGFSRRRSHATRSSGSG